MKQYKNPIIPTSADGRTADSYVIRHDGKYYHCYSGHDGVYITKADELCDIVSGEALKVYSSPESGKLSSWYAPELHYIDGDWYIYGAPAIDDEGKTHCSVLWRVCYKRLWIREISELPDTAGWKRK